MIKQWQLYCEKFLLTTIREQYLVLLTGLIACFFIIFHLFIDPVLVANKKAASKISRLTKSNVSLNNSIAELERGLKSDPNEATRQKITQFEAKLAKIDANLLTLTSDLINPVQMRHALLDLLKLEKGVSLLSFELIGAEPLLSAKASKNKTSDEKIDSNESNEYSQNLYRHGIKLRLSGSYFELQNYLKQLEQLPWKFFWQDFNFKSNTYPKSELEIIIYSLSTKKEFVGV